MREPVPLDVPSLVADADTFETVNYPDDQILLRVTNGDIQVVEFMVDGGAWTRGGPGTVQMLHAGASHSVRIPGGQARLLMVTIGAPYDGFAKAVSALLQRDGYAAADLVETAGKYGVTLG